MTKFSFQLVPLSSRLHLNCVLNEWENSPNVAHIYTMWTSNTNLIHTTLISKSINLSKKASRLHAQGRKKLIYKIFIRSPAIVDEWQLHHYYHHRNIRRKAIKYKSIILLVFVCSPIYIVAIYVVTIQISVCTITTSFWFVYTSPLYIAFAYTFFPVLSSASPKKHSFEPFSPSKQGNLQLYSCQN